MWTYNIINAIHNVFLVYSPPKEKALGSKMEITDIIVH